MSEKELTRELQLGIEEFTTKDDRKLFIPSVIFHSYDTDKKPIHFIFRCEIGTDNKEQVQALIKEMRECFLSGATEARDLQ